MQVITYMVLSISIIIIFGSTLLIVHANATARTEGGYYSDIYQYGGISAAYYYHLRGETFYSYNNYNSFYNSYYPQKSFYYKTTTTTTTTVN